MYPCTTHLQELKKADIFHDMSLLLIHAATYAKRKIEAGEHLSLHWVFTGINLDTNTLKNKDFIILTFNAIISLPSLVLPIEKRNALSNVLWSSFSFLLICKTGMI